MANRASTVVFAVLVCFVGARAQAPDSIAKERSHVDRFSTSEVRAERAEAEANSRIASNANDHQALNARALARLRLGKNNEAYEDLKLALSLKPDSSDYQANFGYVLWKLGRPEEAVTAERAALKLDPKNTTAHYQLGRFLLRLGGARDLKEAIAELRQTLDLDARQYEARFELIAAYRELGDLAQAVQGFLRM